MLAEGILDKAMTAHHILCVVGLLIPIYENLSANYCMLAIFLAEISNPSMTARHLLRLTGRRYTKSYETAELSFICLYIFGRFICCPPVAV